MKPGYGAFILTETETETETENDKMVTVPNVISVSVQYVLLHANFWRPYFISLNIGLCRNAKELYLLLKHWRVPFIEVILREMYKWSGS